MIKGVEVTSCTSELRHLTHRNQWVNSPRPGGAVWVAISGAVWVAAGDTIEGLPPRCRDAFCMYIFDELPNKEIAERLGVSLSMVNQYISRGKLACAARRMELDNVE
ncbi:sigma factor-like helix-turn-helix DNA-binding protein [Comamonas testosteroni]|uniref:sigma-70 region 4 domain-containing protein n=1 Tax=Comamonas testosteroni TaxID=285 RepID=UPI00345F5657